MRPAMFFAFFGPIMVFYSMIHWALPENAQIEEYEDNNNLEEQVLITLNQNYI